jgi:hypothetical protein
MATACAVLGWKNLLKAVPKPSLASLMPVDAPEDEVLIEPEAGE